MFLKKFFNNFLIKLRQIIENNDFKKKKMIIFVYMKLQNNQNNKTINYDKCVDKTVQIKV